MLQRYYLINVILEFYLFYHTQYLKMKFKLFLILFTFFFVSKDVCAQIKLDSNNPNAKHDELIRITDLSSSEMLTKTIINILKEYAIKNGIAENIVLKNEYIFKAILNEKLNLNERIFVCNYFLESKSNGTHSYPILLIDSLKQNLISKKIK